jgi:flavin reductase (DIM6/NTAB) family NADH-FMN oxidoreductase RutF
MFTHISPSDLSARDVYKLMIGCVVPRPIAWISTVDPGGCGNLAPFSYFNGVASKPPVISVSFSYHPERPEYRKDTLRNILATEEFVVNVVSEPNEAAMHASSSDFAPQSDESDELGLEMEASTVVRPPSLTSSPIRLECRLYDRRQVGTGPGSATLVLGEVLHIAVRRELINDRLHIDHEALKPIGRLAGGNYAYIHEIVDLGARP